MGSKMTRHVYNGWHTRIETTSWFEPTSLRCLSEHSRHFPYHLIFTCTNSSFKLRMSQSNHSIPINATHKCCAHPYLYRYIAFPKPTRVRVSNLLSLKSTLLPTSMITTLSPRSEKKNATKMMQHKWCEKGERFAL